MVSTEKTKISRPITTTAQRAKTTAQTKRERISAASSSPTSGPLRREAETGQRYRIPAARQGLVKVKNCLVMLDIVPVGILVLALILSLTI